MVFKSKKPKPKRQWGGARPGAGRKPKPKPSIEAERQEPKHVSEDGPAPVRKPPAGWRFIRRDPELGEIWAPPPDPRLVGHGETIEDAFANLGLHSVRLGRR